MNELINEQREKIAHLESYVEKLKNAINAILIDCQECEFDDETGWFVGVDVISEADDLISPEMADD